MAMQPYIAVNTTPLPPGDNPIAVNIIIIIIIIIIINCRRQITANKPRPHSSDCTTFDINKYCYICVILRLSLRTILQHPTAVSVECLFQCE